MTKDETNGWAIVSTEHPNAPGRTVISKSTFSLSRSECIAKFVEGSAHSWEYWRRKYKFRCVRAIQTIEIPKE